MENRQQRIVESFERVLIYLQQNPVKPEPPLLTSTKRSLAASIERLKDLQQEQMPKASGVEAMVKPLLKFAPGMEKALRVPHARADAAAVAAHTLEVMKTLAPHAEILTSAGLGEDYVAQVTGEAEWLGSASARADEARQRRSRATAAIRDVIRKGMDDVTVVEGILLAHARSTGRSEMAFWRGMRRVKGRLGRPKARQKQASRGTRPAPRA
jgi:hypothetical protein